MNEYDSHGKKYWKNPNRRFGNGVKPQCNFCKKKIVQRHTHSEKEREREILFHRYGTANIFVIFLIRILLSLLRLFPSNGWSIFFSSSFVGKSVVLKQANVWYIFVHSLSIHSRFFHQRYGCNNYYECLTATTTTKKYTKHNLAKIFCISS